MGHELTAISLFVCVTYGFTYLVKALLDLRARALLMRGEGDREFLRALLAAEAAQRRMATLRWGVVLCAIALGFALIQAFGWREITAGVIAVLAGAAGVGHLVFYAISVRVPQPDAPPAPKD